MAWFKDNQSGRYSYIFLISLGFIVFFTLFPLVAFKVWSVRNQRPSAPLPLVQNIKIAGRHIRAEVAVSPLEKYYGLSGRESLCADCGMLFNFSDASDKSFVMRDMKFPLDIIFLYQGKISKIAANLAPEGSRPAIVYESGGPADQVLELNAGYCEAHGLRPGDQLEIN